MEKWKQICAEQVAKLENALELARKASQLASHPDMRDRINPEDINRIASVAAAIKSRMPRLREGQFHIAVVGGEKTGKSSFINAWIDSDLLPNDSERCTFLPLLSCILWLLGLHRGSWRARSDFPRWRRNAPLSCYMTLFRFTPFLP